MGISPCRNQPTSFALVLAAFTACALSAGISATQQAGAPPPNTLSAAEQREGWKLLFNGQSLDGWRAYDVQRDPARSWSAADGCLRNAKNDGRPGSGGGDIVTTEQFTDFDFRFDWRISRGGNSGIKYFVLERLGAPGAVMYVGDDGRSAVGHEYQLLDDAEHPDAKNGPIRQAGSLYSLVPPSDAKTLKPVGEFNESRILVQGMHVEHWLNGARIVQYELESPALLEAVAKSKYKDIPRFGTKFKTRILLQDHGDEVWFRNLRIRPLSH
jgi:3-keto-disaccharide hydrolase